MEREGLKFSLKEILGGQFDHFVDEFLIPQVEQEARSGKIDVNLLRRLRKLLSEKGSSVFDLPASQLTYATRNTLSGGELYSVALPISQGSDVKTFVKVFPSRQAYAVAERTQNAIEAVSRNSGIEDIIVPMSYRNSRLNLMTYPMIDANSLAETLPGLSEEEKEVVLKLAINAHNRFSVALTRNEYAIQKKMSQDLEDLLGPESAFEKLFFASIEQIQEGHTEAESQTKQEQAKATLISLIRHYYNPLAVAPEYVIHPDLNPGNVLLQGDAVKLIDFETLSFGFPEFSLGHLLTKSGVSRSLEDRLVRYAAESLAEAEEKEITENDVRKSANRYELNRIAQELFTAVRYLKRANQASSPALEKMASASYTLALRRLDAEPARHLFGQDFKDAIQNYFAAHSIKLENLGESAEEIMASERMVHAQASQEGVVLARRLDLLSGNYDAKEELEAEIKGVKKSLRNSRIKKMAGRAALVALPLLALAGTYFGIDYFKREARTKQVELEDSEQRVNQISKLLTLSKIGVKLDSDNMDVLGEKYFTFLKARYGDERTAKLFFIDHKLAYTAMRETGSQDYEVLSNYLKEYDAKNFVTIDFAIQKLYLVDNWARTSSEKDVKTSFEWNWNDAEQAYLIKKGLATPTPTP